MKRIVLLLVLFFAASELLVAEISDNYDLHLYFKEKNKYGSLKYYSGMELANSQYAADLEELGFKIKIIDDFTYLFEFYYKMKNSVTTTPFYYYREIDMIPYTLLVRTENIDYLKFKGFMIDNTENLSDLLSSPIELIKLFFSDETLVIQDNEKIINKNDDICLILSEAENLIDIKLYPSKKYICDFFIFVVNTNSELDEELLMKNLHIKNRAIPEKNLKEKYYLLSETEILEKKRLAKLETERKERERLAKIESELQEKKHLAKLETERKEKKRLEKIDAERKEKRLAKLETERKEKERLEKIEVERKERERLARIETERKEKEQLAKLETERKEERLAKIEAVRKEKERLEKIEVEGKERERLEKIEAELKEKKRLAEIEADRKEKEEELAEMEIKKQVDQSENIKEIEKIEHPQKEFIKIDIIPHRENFKEIDISKTKFEYSIEGKALENGVIHDFLDIASSRTTKEISIKSDSPLEMRFFPPKGFEINQKNAGNSYLVHIPTNSKQNKINLTITELPRIPIIFIDKSEISPIEWIGVESLVKHIKKNIKIKDKYGIFYVSGEKLFGKFFNNDKTNYEDIIWEIIYPLPTSAGIRYEHIMPIGNKWLKSKWNTQYYPEIHLFLSQATLQALTSNTNSELLNNQFSDALQEEMKEKNIPILYHVHIEKKNPINMKKLNVIYKKIK